MKTYRLGQLEDWLKIPDVSMLTHGHLNDAIDQATGIILYIYQDKTLLAAQDVTEDIKDLSRPISLEGRILLKYIRYYLPEKLRIMLEHKVLEMLETKNK